jgi:hypothetical protein
MVARPGGPAAKLSPARQGWEINADDLSAGGAAPYVLSCAQATRMSHSYSNNYVHAVYSTKDRTNLIQRNSRNDSIRLLHR